MPSDDLAQPGMVGSRADGAVAGTCVNVVPPGQTPSHGFPFLRISECGWSRIAVHYPIVAALDWGQDRADSIAAGDAARIMGQMPTARGGGRLAADFRTPDSGSQS